jgi:hypothetical protein
MNQYAVYAPSSIREPYAGVVAKYKGVLSSRREPFVINTRYGQVELETDAPYLTFESEEDLMLFKLSCP